MIRTTQDLLTGTIETFVDPAYARRFPSMGAWVSLVALIAMVPTRSAPAQCGPGGDVPGVNAGVSTLLNWDPDGGGPLPTSLVVGGTFTTAGGTGANSIAMRSPVTGQWSAFGTGMDGPVRALAVLPNGNLVAGGEFTTAGGVTARNIARWDGSAWSALGTSLGLGEIRSLAVMPNGDLVAGGYFVDFDSDADFIARWDGAAWSAVGTGMNDSVSSLVVMPNGDLVAGGPFSIAGGVTAYHVARWNGTDWAAIGEGIHDGGSPATVRALAVTPNGDLVAGGAGFVSHNNIARWDGTAWSQLGAWPNDGVNSVVTSLAVLPSGDLMVGGFFTAAGAVSVNHVARWNGSVWSALGTGVDELVFALAVLPTGDLMVGGVFLNAGGGSAEYLARWNGAAWFASGASVNGTYTVTASDAAASDWFGNVSIDGGTIVVGARQDDNPTGVDAGAAYVYVKSGPPGSEVWTQQAKLIGEEPIFGLETGNQSGISVDISGNTALVGSWLWPQGNATGLMYIFVRSGPPGSEVWTQQAAPACPQFGSYQYFGVSLALEGDTALVGSLAATGLNVGGQAFFYRRTTPPGGGVSWYAQQVFPSDGVPGDTFGISVAMSPSQDTGVVGACFEDNAGGTDAGSAYVFVRSGDSWSEQAKLTASDGAALDEFGRQVAVDGDTVVVGARFDDHTGGANAGAAYVFTRSGTVWTQQAKLTASDAAEGDEFGLALTLSGDRLIVGAYSDDHAGGADAGSAYVFTRVGTAWTEQFKLMAPDAAAGDAFGGSVALSGDTAVVSSIFDDNAGGTDAGSVYVLDLATSPPLFTDGPDSLAVCAGFQATFSVTASGTPTSYQWRRGGSPLADEPNHISGATGATLTIVNTTGADGGSYDCVAANGCGSVTSDAAALTVNSADFDGDGDTGTDLDIEAFFACLGGDCCATCGSADFDGDGDTGTDLDIEAFFRVLGGGAC